MDPADLTALAAALEIPFRARREQRRFLQQLPASGPRASPAAAATRRAARPHRQGVTYALRLHQHLNLPGPVIGALFDTTRSVSHATTLTASLLAAARRRPPPGPPRHPAAHPRRPARLRRGHGIVIPALNQAERTPPHDTLTTPATPPTRL